MSNERCRKVQENSPKVVRLKNTKHSKQRIESDTKKKMGGTVVRKG